MVRDKIFSMVFQMFAYKQMPHSFCRYQERLFGISRHISACSICVGDLTGVESYPWMLRYRFYAWWYCVLLFFLMYYSLVFLIAKRRPSLMGGFINLFISQWHTWLMSYTIRKGEWSGVITRQLMGDPVTKLTDDKVRLKCW